MDYKNGAKKGLRDNIKIELYEIVWVHVVHKNRIYFIYRHFVFLYMFVLCDLCSRAKSSFKEDVLKDRRF